MRHEISVPQWLLRLSNVSLNVSNLNSCEAGQEQAQGTGRQGVDCYMACYDGYSH